MAGMKPYPLTSDHIAFYREHGYVQLDAVLTAEELDHARKAMDAVLAAREKHMHYAEKDDYGRIFLQMVNLWRVDPGIKQYTLNPRIAEIARRLLGCDKIRLWHDHALVKMPGDSRATPWHQDLPYWPMNEDGTSLSCWMALDDVDETNGCMSFVPGSHKLGRLEPISLTDPQDIFSLPEAAGVALAQARPMVMKAGSCTFHDGRTFHYAGANNSGRPRRAMVTIYMADGTTYSGKRHIVTDPLELAVGDPLEGELFPVLADGTAEQEGDLLGI